MQFKVPQFLEIEDKIFGPFTFKEGIYLAGGGGLCFIIYRLLGFWLGAIPILCVAGFSAALIFYKPNSKPFINMVESWFKYMVQDKLYIWERRKVKKGSNEKRGAAEELGIENKSANKLSGSRLRDLAWSLDVLDTRKQTGQKNI